MGRVSNPAMASRSETEPAADADAADPWPRLMAGCRRGDHAAFAEVVALTEPRIRRLLGRMAGRGADLDDIVQETYLRAWRKLGGFRGDCQPLTWLTRIAINVARNVARARRPVTAPQEALEQAPAAPAAWGEDRVLAAYERALDRLPPDQRAAFLLHETEGMTYQAVADTLGCPIGTVMSRLHRARAQILNDLREASGDWAP